MFNITNNVKHICVLAHVFVSFGLRGEDQGTVPDSCLSCEYSILQEGFEFIKGACGEPCFSTSKDDSLDKKQIQIIVVIVVKLIFDSAPQLLRSYEGNESVARIVRHLFSNSTYIKL